MSVSYGISLCSPTVVGLSVTVSRRHAIIGMTSADGPTQTCRLILNTRASSSTREEEISSIVDIHIE
jgi:hypothetical protein